MVRLSVHLSFLFAITFKIFILVIVLEIYIYKMFSRFECKYICIFFIRKVEITQTHYTKIITNFMYCIYEKFIQN